MKIVIAAYDEQGGSLIRDVVWVDDDVFAGSDTQQTATSVRVTSKAGEVFTLAARMLHERQNSR